MRSIRIETEITEFENTGDLSREDQELVRAAREAAKASWSPYSGFAVGAAVRLVNGIVIQGCNVENAAFPSGICAEHNALSSAASLHPGIAPESIAVTAVARGIPVEQPVSPCGKCRQIIAEEETRYRRSVRVIMAGTKSIRIISKGSDLLPLLFSGKDIRP